MTWTAQTESDIRADIADTNAEQAFSSDELARLYERAGQKHYATCVLAVRQLIANAVKLETWKQQDVSLDGQEVFDRLNRMLEMFEAEADKESEEASSRMVFRTIRPQKTRTVKKPRTF